MDRRSVLRLAALSLLATGCRGEAPPTAGPSNGRPARRPTPPAASPSPAQPTRYTPLPGEQLPNLKQVAADFVMALTTRSQGQRPEDVMSMTAGLVSPTFSAGAALRTAAPLLGEQVSIGQIVYPQLSGLLPLGRGARQAGVMVVVRQILPAPGGSNGEVVRVCDVRLEVVQDAWRVTELASIGGEPVDRPAGLDPLAAAVLDDPRLELPDTCRWDIHAGRISADLLSLLAGVAAVAPVAVTVLRSGHPANVFGTAKVSNHTEGRAVDVWRVAGQPLVGTGAASGAAQSVLAAAGADPRTRQTGSPAGSDLDGPGRRSFTDLVHHDHLHLAVGAVANG